MKRLLSSLVLVASLCTAAGVAVAAIKAGTAASGRAVLSTSAGSAMLSSATGIGVVRRGGKSAPQPNAFDVRFPVEPKSDGMKWVTGFLTGKTAPTLDASLQLVDQNYKVQQLLSLGSTSIVELELPGADAKASKQILEFRLRLQPSQLKLDPAQGEAVTNSGGKVSKLTAGAFRVSIDGAADQFVTAVSPAVVRRSGSGVMINGLAVTLPLAQALTGDWWKWAQDPDREKTLRIEYLDASLKSALLTVDFKGVGIESFQISDLGAGAETQSEISYRLTALGVSLR